MIEDELKRAIRKRNVILFVGAGVSATLGLPTWNKLLEKMGEDLGFDKQLYSRHGNNLVLAEYYSLVMGSMNELRTVLEKEQEDRKAEVEKSEVFHAIVDLGCPVIYTTNYDHFLEYAYEAAGKPYRRIVEVEDLVALDPAATQIVKFHGDVSKEDSIVLTESSYFDRLNFESPMDIKLRADMLGKTILFLGYSLSDINVRILLYKLDQLWRKSNAARRPMSYIFLPTPNEVQERILESRGITPIIGEKLNKKDSMQAFLKKLRE